VSDPNANLFDVFGNPVQAWTVNPNGPNDVFIFNNGEIVVAQTPEEVAAAKARMNKEALKGIASVAALVGSAALAGALMGPSAATAVNDAAASSAAASASELAPITLPAGVTSITVAPEVATAAAAAGSSLPVGAIVAGAPVLKAFPSFSGAQNTVSDALNSAVGQMASGALPPPPVSVTSPDFRTWAISTAKGLVQTQLGRSLTAEENALVEQGAGQQIDTIQRNLAANGTDTTTTFPSNLSPELSSLMSGQLDKQQLLTYGLVGVAAIGALYFAMG
jgi:hypothetical protein